MRLFTIVLSCITFSVCMYWVWITYPEVRTFTKQAVFRHTLQTLEIRHTAESLMELHKKELLKDSVHAYLEPELKFHPYLLLEVKYLSSNERTGEGMLLWSLIDGEMVINTNTWDKSHGFADCLEAGADRNDFKLINALSLKGGSADREALSKILNAENDVLDSWIESCRKKNLIAQSGNHYRLHFQNPRIQVIPETKLDQWLVTKPTLSTNCSSGKYRTSEIELMAKNAFGKDFTIRKSTKVYLPVHSIVVQNPDGSVMTTYWNALNGKKLDKSYHIE